MGNEWNFNEKPLRKSKDKNVWEMSTLPDPLAFKEEEHYRASFYRASLMQTTWPAQRHLHEQGIPIYYSFSDP